jgi:hypothetical protein
MGLTNKQRQMLDNFIKKYKDKVTAAFMVRYDCNAEMLKDVDAILNIRCFRPTTIHDIERYVSEKIFGGKLGA